MSLVEKALEKMRENSRRPDPAAGPRGVRLEPGDQVYGKVVRTTGRSPSPGATPVPERIVAVDQDALRATGLLPPQHQARQIAEQYRQIKRPLIANAIGR